jgi:hypothetical protein
LDVDKGKFSLRPMQSDDDTKKLSLGNDAFTPLKTFLVKDAWAFHSTGMGKTYVLVQDGSRQIWGYITLTASEVNLDAPQRPEIPERAARYPTFPAVKIARLAVDQRIQGCRFGTMMLEWAMGHIRAAIMPHIGCRFVVVDSKVASVSFYHHAGFISVAGQINTPDATVMMFLDLAKVENVETVDTAIMSANMAKILT